MRDQKNKKINCEIIAMGDMRLLESTGNPRIENETLLNFQGIEKRGDVTVVRGNFIEYKNFLEQQKHPDFTLDIKPIGVSGITIFREDNIDYAIFAERADDVTEYPGFFELIPSGSIDQEYASANGVIDYKAKLLSEFSEETGLSKDCVKEISGLALVLDTDHNVYDVCCKILIAAKKAQISDKFKNSKEYRSPIFVPLDQLDDFIKTKIDRIVPTSVALIDAYRKSANEYGK